MSAAWVVLKFGKVSSLDHQISLAREGPMLSRGSLYGAEGVRYGGRGHVQAAGWELGLGGRAGVGGPCIVRSNTTWIMVTWEPLVDRQTRMTENIIFTQLRWQAVKHQRLFSR